MQPQLGFPDGRADEKDERAVAHIAQPAMVGKCGRQAVAQFAVERVQPKGAFDEPAQAGLPDRFERVLGAWLGRGAWMTRSGSDRHECHHRSEIPEGT